MFCFDYASVLQFICGWSIKLLGMDWFVARYGEGWDLTGGAGNGGYFTSVYGRSDWLLNYF